MLLVSSRVAEQHALSLQQEAVGISTADAYLEQPAQVGSTLKVLFDVLLAATLLLLLSPLLLIIAAACRIDGGPALFGHRRVGRGGTSFKCLKFRTMMVDADHVLQAALENNADLMQEWMKNRKLRNDPRVSVIGSFLRKTSLDELPQLINVVRGDMSLVGPRPIVDAEIGYYGGKIDRYYAVRPGLTGLWQVSGRSTTTFDRRVELDAWYVDHWTLLLDARLLVKTIPALLSREGAF